ncbi:MAG: type II toxin-antitoxin system RelB/DinJ family antitoxin [Elusimicrobiota bacterium]|jgi:DNA-damage-inducible protein J|nr:type II toxin-antitoxin system RelB/DinJ family antitoxin [Elusimicrobiota bacterium]
MIKKNAIIHVRVNENIKKNVDTTLSKLGISIAEAINIFFYKIILEQAIPFSLNIPNKKYKNDTEYLESIPGMMEKIIEGMNTPSAELEDFNWNE